MSAVNNKFRCYGYKEETAFQGLEPKLMEQLGEEFVIGKLTNLLSLCLTQPHLVMIQ